MSEDQNHDNDVLNAAQIVIEEATATATAQDLELETDMPQARALRRRARFYIEQTHSNIDVAMFLVGGRSGLTQDEQIQMINGAATAVETVIAQANLALADLKAAAIARADEA